MMSVRSRVKLAVEQLCLDASLDLRGGLSLTGFNLKSPQTYGTNSVYDFYDQVLSTAFINLEMSYVFKFDIFQYIPLEYGMSCAT